MEPCSLKFVRVLFFGGLLMFISPGSKSTPPPATTSSTANNSDELALIDFKNGITDDPLQIMNLWNDSIHFCKWVGVTCSSSNGRVITLNLVSLKLIGSVPPSFGNLTFLTSVNLQNNSFRGELPQELGRLLHLQHLILSRNYFSGKIPSNLSHCTDLRNLSINHKQLGGSIPDQLGSLTKLAILRLGNNNLTGRIPTWIGNFSLLEELVLYRNKLHSIIPHELGRLSHLTFFQLAENNLSGTFPWSVFNLSSIYMFSISGNQLQGQIPSDVSLNLPNLEVFLVAANKFSGPLPLSLPNATKLESIDFAFNSFTGMVPRGFGSLQVINYMNFQGNKLGNGRAGNLNFVSSLTNCTSLEVLGLDRNQFGGKLPYTVANLSTSLRWFTLASNLVHGTVPIGIGNLINMTLLVLEDNFLSGSVPDSIGKLQHLQELYLSSNNFSGKIPSSLGNLTSLTMLYMDRNRLEGRVPQSLGNCQNLLLLNLSINALSGTIPKEVTHLSSLSISLSMAHNSLSGSLPVDVGSLRNLQELDIAQNKLVGEIPSSLSSCLVLEILLLENNLLQGTIPESLRSLKGLVKIDLSLNNLSGQLPEFLGKLSSLKVLNLSFNNFEGEVPKDGIFSNASGISVFGNGKLCGGVQILQLPECPEDKSPSSKNFLSPRLVIPIAVSIAFVVISCSFAIFYTLRNVRKRPLASPSTKDWHLGVSYAEVVKSTNGFSTDSLIGSGSFGSVYKGICHVDGPVVAVKVLNLQQQGASESFVAECKPLRSVRHRNLLKIITVCSSVDHQGNDFKCLVFEFMTNGSLDQLLHPREVEEHRARGLNILQRLNIAIDVASALDYLHHHCQPPIVHCDLKPSNILLDDDMVPHVGDLGLARFLYQSSEVPSQNQNISMGLKGSIGYIPPEYGMGGQVACSGDVYSFGILLLEMFTSKRPTDDIFKDGLSIHEFVKTALPEHVLGIADPLLLSTEAESTIDVNERTITRNIDNSNFYRMKECLASVMTIGLLCSDTLPDN